MTQSLDPFAAADKAGLVYVNDATPGITRRREDDRWVYRRPDRAVIDDPGELRRIAAMAIPPAWTQVWISPIAEGHILATGRDARGCKQYRYHPLYRAVRDGTKYHRMAPFGASLPILRTRIEQDLSLEGLPRDKVLAAAVRLLDETLIRVGNEEYERQNHSYGITTLHHDHVRVEGECVQFEFRAKSGKEQHVRLRDPLLARILHASEELPGQDLFQYVDDHGHLVRVNSADVNRYLRDATADIFTAKNFRTWGGSVIAAEALAATDPPRSPADAKRKLLVAFDAAADRLNNTRAVSRKSYVHPRVPESWVEGTLTAAFTRTRSRGHLSHAEAAVLDIIADTAQARDVENR